MSKYKKTKGWKPHHPNTTAVEFEKDTGPAHIALVFPLPRPGAGQIMRPLGISEQYVTKIGKHLDKNEHLVDAMHGFMCVKSATEEYSVREVAITTPLKRIQYDSEKAEAASVEKMLKGPRLVTVPSARCTCSCGTHVYPVRTLIERSTVKKEVETEINGKKIKKIVFVAADDLESEITGIRDLQNHEVRCPECGSVLQKIGAQKWRLSDRELVKSDLIEQMVRDALKAEEAKFKAGKGGEFAYAAPVIVDVAMHHTQELPRGADDDIINVAADAVHSRGGSILDWNSAIQEGHISSLYVICKEIATFSVANAQDLRNLGFGDQKENLSFWGRIGFVPQDKIREPPKPGQVTVGELFDFNAADITV